MSIVYSEQVMDTKELPKSDLSKLKSSEGTFLQALKLCFNISVEPLLFLNEFALNLNAVTNITLTMQMVCSAEMSYSDVVCENFLHQEEYIQQKIVIQQSTNNWGILNIAVTVLPAVFLCLLFGPWSDKYGRRLPLFLPLIGGAISSAIFITIAYVDYKFPPYMIVLAYIPEGLTGFSSTLISMSYLADVTPHDDRSMKFIFVEGITMLGAPLGYIVAGYIQKLYGFGPVFILALTCQITALLYGVIFLKETQGLKNEDNWKTRLRYFFNFKTLTESFKACCRVRPGNGRMVLLFLSITLFSSMFFMSKFRAFIIFYYIGVYKIEK